MKTSPTPLLKNLVQLNLATFLISTSGPLGRYIDLPVPTTIGIRSCIAVILLYVFCRWKKIPLSIRKQDRMIIILGGILMGLHWITYFYALQWSSVAIGMLSLYTYPVLTALIEPIFFRTKIQKTHLFLGFLVLIGLYILIPDFNLENTYTKAIGIGVFSALCYAFRNIIMKSKVNVYHGSSLMWHQLVIISCLCIPFLWDATLPGLTTNWKPLLGLALFTTSIGHTLFLYSFKNFSVTTASIISSLQPIYGIIIGALLLSEIPSWHTIIGGGLIFSSVIIESIRSYQTQTT